MSTLKITLNDKIDGWNNNQQQPHPPSQNMLRVLQSKIIKSIKLQQLTQQIEKTMQNKLALGFLGGQRPATVRVRPCSSNRLVAGGRGFEEELGSIQVGGNYGNQGKDGTPRVGRNCQSKLSRVEGYEIKFRNKSLGNNSKQLYAGKQNITNTQTKNLLNKKNKIQNIQLKKQSLVFNNFQTLKPKKSQKTINNFHQMQIKLRKNRLTNPTTGTTTATTTDQPQKIHILVQSYRKGTQIKISQTNIGQRTQRPMQQNINQLILLEKVPEGQYTKLSRKNKYLNKQRESFKKQIKRQLDIFTDAHFGEQSLNIKNIF